MPTFFKPAPASSPKWCCNAPAPTSKFAAPSESAMPCRAQYSEESSLRMLRRWYEESSSDSWTPLAENGLPA